MAVDHRNEVKCIEEALCTIKVNRKRVVQYSDKLMHGIVLYSLHITIPYKSITIKNEAKQ